MQEILKNQTIKLERYQMEDSIALYQAINHSYAEISPWLDWLTPNYNQQSASEFIKLQISNWNEGLEYTFAIKNHSNELLGTISLHVYDTQNDVASLGYWVNTKFSGLGYCTQAVKLLVKNTFDALNLIRIEVIVASDNIASQKVAEKSGAKCEAILKNRIRLKGRPVDAKMYAFTL